MTSRLPALGVTLMLVACAGDQDAAGRYVTTPESLRASFEATFPSADDPNGKLLRDRFEQMAGDTAMVSLELATDGSFSMEMRLPGLPSAVRRSGSWTQAGDDVVLQITQDGERPLAEARTQRARLDGETIHLQDSPHAPLFVLQKT